MVLARSIEFLKCRVGDQVAIRFKEKWPYSIYRDDEKGWKDEFEKAFGSEENAYYVGKDYNGGATEIVSMGLELLRQNPGRFAERDPEYLKFLLGMLDGTLR